MDGILGAARQCSLGAGMAAIRSLEVQQTTPLIRSERFIEHQTSRARMQ